jgi:preprotein translocase subunit SecA
VEHLDQALARQRERIGAPFPFVGRYLILTTLDEAWRTHLYNLDDLKGGIGWTAYAGTDPLVAFKRESFVLFQEMLGSTADKIIRMLLNPRLTVGESSSTTTTTAPRQPVRFVHGGERPIPPPRAEAPAPDARRPVHVAAEPGRNDPCPCGSGKKYKKCHGAGR